MNFIKYIPVLAFSTVAFSSCSDLLDVQPEGNFTTTTYFENDQQAINSVTELYKILQQESTFGRGLAWEQGAACDMVWGRTRDFSTVATMNYTGDESPFTGAFDAFYETIAYANWVVQELKSKESSATLTSIEQRSLGEAYFMRALSHFMIAYRYGTEEQGVPFVRYEDYSGGYDYSIPPQLPSVLDNFQYIIEDMESAKSYLPTFEEYDADDQGRAHQAAAVAYQAKVYAYWATWDSTKWSNVISLVNELESSYGRALAPTFTELFSSDFADFWPAEYIWSVPSTGGATGGGIEFTGVVLENKGWGIYNGWGQLKPTLDIYEQMLKDGEGNIRLTTSILEYNQEFTFWGDQRLFYSESDVEAGFQINKYMDAFKHSDASTAGYVNTNGDFPTSRINFPLIRFAEMLLFRAEAYIMTGQAASAKVDINAIRTRSELEPITHTPTMEDLYHERRCELAFEFTDHFYDLKRWYISSDATIKAIASAELNSRPRVRHYADRSNPESTFEIGYYEDYTNKSSYAEYKMVFPYPSTVIVNSNGQLKQNSGY